MIGRAVGNYVVLERVGSGGMGTVFLAEHPRIKRKVAIKVLRTELADDAEAVARFFTEARSANEIRNEHIIEILDFGEFEGGAPYLIMEWLEGTTLTQFLAQHPQPPLDRTVQILAGISDALDAAHARSIVHRDLKPDNIFLVDRGLDPYFVKVLDFGIAKLLHQRGASFKTRTNTIVGTPAYMSPEQCRSAHDQIDGRSDVYSLGVIAYQMITGRIPFDAPSALGMIGAHAAQPPPALRSIDPAIPEAVEAAVLRALEKAPEKRFQSAGEMVTVIAAGAGVSLSVSRRFTLPLTANEPAGRPAGDAQLWHANTIETPLPSPLPSSTPNPGAERPEPDTLGTAAAQMIPGVTRSLRRRLAFGSAALALVLVAAAFVAVGVLRRPEAREQAPGALQAAAQTSAPAAASPTTPASPVAVAPAPSTAPPPAEAPSPPAPAPSPAAPSPVPTVAAVPAAAPSARPSEVAANRVSVAIQAEPAGAEVLLDEAPLPNPFKGAFGRSGLGHHLVVKLHGYRTSSTWEVFDRDRKVTVRLKPGSGAAAATTAHPSSTPATVKAAAPPSGQPAATPPPREAPRPRPMHTDDPITPSWDKDTGAK